MTWVAVVLIGIGVADLTRAPDARRSRWVGHVVGPLVIVVVAVLAGLTAAADLVALLLSWVGVVAWTELSHRTHTTGRGALAALGSLGVTLALLLAFSGWASPPDGPLADWLVWADLPGAPTTPARLLLLVGLTLFNIATANVIVRLVLLAIGALRPDALTTPQPPQPADRLKGGRLLGPMERLVILGLGLAGEFGAASLVIAAKGLLRFPEIQAAGRANAVAASAAGAPNGRVGIDDVTEYFLVGSFVSWLVALISLGIAQ